MQSVCSTSSRDACLVQACLFCSSLFPSFVANIQQNQFEQNQELCTHFHHLQLILIKFQSAPLLLCIVQIGILIQRVASLIRQLLFVSFLSRRLTTLYWPFAIYFSLHIY